MDSKEYFTNVAHTWDSMRKGFFSENVREKAYQIAGVRAGAVAADLGAGTGFLTEGLVKRGARVIAIDEVAEMLRVLERNIAREDLVECRLGESARLPLEDAAVDYVFANMYLHHVESPPAAIKEMFRVLKPGGKVVITDLDAHNHEFLRVEHNDRWMGFQRNEIKRWFDEAGFRNAVVDCVGETCNSKSEVGDQSASISIFVASGDK